MVLWRRSGIFEVVYVGQDVTCMAGLRPGFNDVGRAVTCPFAAQV